VPLIFTEGNSASPISYMQHGYNAAAAAVASSLADRWKKWARLILMSARLCC